jgi:putative lipoprotein
VQELTEGQRSRVACVATFAVWFAACGSSPQSADVTASKAAAPSKSPITARFDCDTLALTAIFHEDRVVIELPERSLTLPHVVSGSGARYSDGAITFWNKGREATFENEGRTQTCRERHDPWLEAAERGVDFRAVGQEPGWFLEIDKEKEVRLVYDYAEHELVAPVPSAVRKGTAILYETTVKAQHLVILIEEAACKDVMSGEAFPRTVTVTIGDRTLRGCGRDVAFRH